MRLVCGHKFDAAVMLMDQINVVGSPSDCAVQKESRIFKGLYHFFAQNEKNGTFRLTWPG